MDRKYVFEFQSTTVVAHGEPVFVPPSLFFEHVLKLRLEQEHEVLPRDIILKREKCEERFLFVKQKDKLFSDKQKEKVMSDEEEGKVLSDEEEEKLLLDNEILIYQRLRPLQGTIIPKFFGLANMDGYRAILLSDIGGIAMVREEMPRFEAAMLEELLAHPVRLIRQHGVILKDLRLCNVHWCGNEFRIFDFEDAEIVTTGVEDQEAYVRDRVGDLIEQFLRRQDGILGMAKLGMRRCKRRKGNASTAPQRGGARVPVVLGQVGRIEAK